MSRSIIGFPNHNKFSHRSTSNSSYFIYPKAFEKRRDSKKAATPESYIRRNERTRPQVDFRRERYTTVISGLLTDNESAVPYSSAILISYIKCRFCEKAMLLRTISKPLRKMQTMLCRHWRPPCKQAITLVSKKFGVDVLSHCTNLFKVRSSYKIILDAWLLMGRTYPHKDMGQEYSSALSLLSARQEGLHVASGMTRPEIEPATSRTGRKALSIRYWNNWRGMTSYLLQNMTKYAGQRKRGKESDTGGGRENRGTCKKLRDIETGKDKQRENGGWEANKKKHKEKKKKT